ncbi:MAG TPA: SCO family protein [Anaeromyxobacter sp.]
MRAGRAATAATAAGLALALALAAATPAHAQFWRSKDQAAGPRPTDVTPVALEDVRIEERLGNQVPLDVTLEDGAGRPFRFASAFDGRHPIVLALVYYDCPMLCGLILSGAAKAMRENGLVLGKDYQAVTISFDPDEKPIQGAERRRGYLQSMGRTDAGSDWPFLVGTADATRRIADAVGFYFKKDEVSGEFAHMAAIFVLTPDGKVSRYLYGIEYPPKDLRLALVEAADGKVGTSFDRFLLTCYRYNPASRKYEPYALGVVRAGALAVLVALTGLIAGMVWRERRARGRPRA